MRKTSFSDDQIVTILADMDAGLPVIEICREQGISQTLYYPLKEQLIGYSSERTEADTRDLKSADAPSASLVDALLKFYSE